MIRSTYLRTVFDRREFAIAIRRAAEALKGVEFDSFAVSGNSGALFGGALSLRMRKGLFLVRKGGERTHAAHKVEGDESRTRYIFLDDLLDTGTTRQRVRAEMEKHFPQARRVGQYLYHPNSFPYGYTTL